MLTRSGFLLPWGELCARAVRQMDWAEAGVAESAQHITEPVRADPKDHQGGPVGGGGPAATASRPGGCGRARPGPPPAPHGRAGGPEPRAPPGGASERWSL